jgi:hypothetical protein
MTSVLDSLSPIQKRLLILLQNSLWGKVVDTSLFGEVSHGEWAEIMELAAIQGVFGLAYDGLSGLPEEYRPQRELLIQWALGVKKIEIRHNLQLNALQSLVDLYEKNGIRCLLLKGIGISQLYPIPEHRECGDIDLYLFGDYDKGNHLMEEKGIKVDKQGDKHSKFEFEQIPVENHLSFLQIEGHQTNRELELILLQKLSQEDPGFSEELKVYLPPLSFNLLFLHNHAVTHFLGSGIVLRHLCDWALLLNQCMRSDDYSDFNETVKRFDLQHYADVFSFIAVEYLGLPCNEQFTANQDPPFTQKVLTDIFKQGKVYPFPPRRNMIEVIKGKSKGAIFLFKNRWKYEAVNKKMFHQELMFRLRYVSQIFGHNKPF